MNKGGGGWDTIQFLAEAEQGRFVKAISAGKEAKPLITEATTRKGGRLLTPGSRRAPDDKFS